MPRSIVIALVLSVLVPGCGLALDYDPPTDAGGGMDGALDVGTCAMACTGGTVCIDGSCLHPCDDSSDCHFDDAVCEICDTSIGACRASDATCGGGCNAICDPIEDRCRADCDDGQSCIDESCVEGIPCTTPSDCPSTSIGCGFECTMGLCQSVPVLTCPGHEDYECAEVDLCTSCDPIVVSDGCGLGEICDVAGGTYRCVQCNADQRCLDSAAPICDEGTCRACNEDGECAAAGLGRACVSNRCVPCDDAGDCEAEGLGGACVDNTCVPCDADVDCRVAAAPVCNLATNQCVACVRSADCPTNQVCRSASNTCGPCVTNEDCGGATCDVGTCRRACNAPVDCPPTCAGTATNCTAGRCVYGAPPAGACDDESACTEDSCVPNDPRANAFGCLRIPRHERCDDGIACTVDLCTADAGGRSTCVRTPTNAICRGVVGGEPRCLESICVPSADASDSRGCVPSYVGPCAPGQVCRTDGTCAVVSTCADCRDDGLACNGVETCAGGVCVQSFADGGSCNGECDQYCASSTSCADIPGVPDVTCRVATTTP